MNLEKCVRLYTLVFELRKNGRKRKKEKHRSTLSRRRWEWPLGHAMEHCKSIKRRFRPWHMGYIESLLFFSFLLSRSFSLSSSNHQYCSSSSSSSKGNALTALVIIDADGWHGAGPGLCSFLIYSFLVLQSVMPVCVRVYILRTLHRPVSWPPSIPFIYIAIYRSLYKDIYSRSVCGIISIWLDSSLPFAIQQLTIDWTLWSRENFFFIFIFRHSVVVEL